MQPWNHHRDTILLLGNDAIHALTKDGKQMLRVDLQKFSREKAHATYSSFFVDNEANKYRLKLGTFNGTKGLGMLTMYGICLSLYCDDLLSNLIINIEEKIAYT